MERRRPRYRLLVLLAAFYILIGACSSVITGLVVKSGIDQTFANQRNASISACKRSQIQNAKDNKSQYADWTYDKIFLLLVEHPAASQRQSAQEAAALKQFLGPLKGAIAAKAWVPLIQDCRAEIAQRGSGFVPPQPIPFDRQLPPKSALSVPSHL